MYEFISGKIEEITPASIIIEQQGIGYFISISVYTYTQLSDKQECKLYIHQIVREDAHLLFGFAGKGEREVFRHLLSVNGVGANTARMMLSSLTPVEIQDAILQNNVQALKSIKGIGAKSAQRIIVDLRDKIGKGSGSDEKLPLADNTIHEEALSALVMLGFPKGKVNKVLSELTKKDPSMSVEDLVKTALKRI